MQLDMWIDLKMSQCANFFVRYIHMQPVKYVVCSKTWMWAAYTRNPRQDQDKTIITQAVQQLTNPYSQKSYQGKAGWLSGRALGLQLWESNSGHR